MDLLTGVEPIRFVQQLASPAMDVVFGVLSGLGSAPFFLVVLPIIYWVGNRRVGYRLLMLFLLGLFLNFWLKEVFHTPRPPADLVRVVAPETTFAFPSGHTQATALFWTYVADEWRHGGLFFLGVLLILLVGLSRMYLGVHYLGDVLGGAAIGITLALVGRRLWVRLSRVVDLESLPLQAAGVLAPFLLLWLYPGVEVQEIVGGMVGLSLGFAVGSEDRYFRRREELLEKVSKVFIGLTVLFLIRAILQEVFPPLPMWRIVTGFLEGLWVTLLAPTLFRWVNG